ncbi:MAG: NAD(P)-dependent oxidoreductase [Armatimonadota bacterium]
MGVIGLGRMGLPMARHLLTAGFAVWGCDTDSQRGELLVGAGGTSAESPRALGEVCDAILVMVADDAQVTTVTVGPGGALESARAGSALIIASSVTPQTCTHIAEAARAKGVGVLDAPVTRGQRAAEAGTLTVLVGGPREVFERCRPVFAAFGRQVFHLDEQVGAGQVAKMANNLLLWTGVAGVHAAFSLARRLGVRPTRLREALAASSADSYVLREMELLTLAWPEKDLAQLAAMADDAGIALPLVGYVRELMRGLTREELRRLCSDEIP